VNLKSVQFAAKIRMSSGSESSREATVIDTDRNHDSVWFLHISTVTYKEDSQII
jgi:hypothetical protein